MVNNTLFSPHPFLNHRFASNPVLTGFFTGPGAAGYAPLAIAYDIIQVCRALPALHAPRTLPE